MIPSATPNYTLVAVEDTAEETTTTSGLIVSKKSIEPPGILNGLVVDSGPLISSTGNVLEPLYRPGQRVWFPKSKSADLKIDDVQYFVVYTLDLIAFSDHG